jgi:hypothetical protein
MKSVGITSLSVATFVSAVGCGGPNPSGTNAPASGVSPSSGASSGASASGPSTSATTKTPEPPSPLSIGGFAHGTDASVLPGVQVCLYRGFSFATDSAGVASVVLPDPGDCAVSAADGSFRVSGAHAGDFAMLTFRKDAFAPTLRAIAMQTDNITLPPNENVLMPAPLIFMGTPVDPDKGQISFSATTPGGGPAADVSVTSTVFGILSGFANTSEGARYLDGNGALVPGATAGSAGGFVNVHSGFYVLRFDAAAGKCTASSGLYGYPVTGSPDALIEVPVVAGYVSASVGMSCTAGP